MLKINGISYAYKAMPYGQIRNNSINFKSKRTEPQIEEVVLPKEKEDEINTEAKEALKNSVEILKTANKNYLNVLGLLRGAKAQQFSTVYDKSGNIQRRFWGSENSMLMQEFKNGKIAREAEFNPETLEITNIYENIRHLKGRKVKIGKIYKFSEGKLVRYTQDYKNNSEEETMSKQYRFADEKLNKYTQDYTRTPYESLSISINKKYKSISFDSNGKVSLYLENYKRDNYGAERAEVAIRRAQDGKWQKIELADAE